MDQVEQAFKKFDLDNDGFLSREEFDQVLLVELIFQHFVGFYINNLKIVYFSVDV